jgi:hypothetical protein
MVEVAWFWLWLFPMKATHDAVFVCTWLGLHDLRSLFCLMACPIYLLLPDPSSLLSAPHPAYLPQYQLETLTSFRNCFVRLSPTVLFALLSFSNTGGCVPLSLGQAIQSNTDTGDVMFDICPMQHIESIRITPYHPSHCQAGHSLPLI